jgi:hypothetical protein
MSGFDPADRIINLLVCENGPHYGVSQLTSGASCT